MFCTFNAEELDALLHTNPVYKRPGKRPVVEREAPFIYSSNGTSKSINGLGNLGTSRMFSSSSSEPIVGISSKRNVNSQNIVNSNATNQSPLI